MKIPLILADFGPVFAAFLLVLLSLPLVLAVVSVVLGCRKKRDQHSILGVVLGIISISAAAYFVLSGGPPDLASPLTYLAFSPIPLGALGTALCLRKKTAEKESGLNGA